MHVEDVAATRISRVVAPAEAAALRTEDGTAVHLEPFADLAENARRLLRHRAIGPWADVEQVVTPVARADRKITQHLSRTLPLIVGRAVTPAIVERHARFPRPTVLGRFDLLLRRGEVAFDAVAIVHDDARLQLE